MSDIDDSRAPLLDHLIELRRRLLWSVAAMFGGVRLICLLFRPSRSSPSWSSRC